MALSVWAANGAQIPASMGRVLAFVASGGARGIAQPGDLKVTALGTPTSKIQIEAGGAIIPSKYSGSQTQSYVVSETASSQLNVTATSSSGGRNDLVVLRVRDADFESGSTGAEFTIIQGVADTVIESAGNASLYCKTLSYPAIPLAGLIIPKSTSTITSAMIRDLRSLARPRQHVETQNLNCGVDATFNSTTQGYFPVGGDLKFLSWVPEWATHVTFRLSLQNLEALNPGSNVRFFPFFEHAYHNGEEVVNTASATSGNNWMNLHIRAARINVTAYQGKQVTFALQSMLSAAGGGIKTRAIYTKYAIDIIYTEETI